MKYKLETSFFNHISRVFHVHRWDTQCLHHEVSFRLFLGECAIDKKGINAIVEWALAIGLKCGCELIKRIPQILINNPYYFPEIKFIVGELSHFTAYNRYPLIDFISGLCAEDMLEFVIIGDEVGETEETTNHEYLRLDCHNLSNLAFGEVDKETFDGKKDSEWSLVFCFNLDNKGVEELREILNIGQKENDGGPDISDFIEAYYREEDHE